MASCFVTVSCQGLQRGEFYILPDAWRVGAGLSRTGLHPSGMVAEVWVSLSLSLPLARSRCSLLLKGEGDVLKRPSWVTWDLFSRAGVQGPVKISCLFAVVGFPHGRSLHMSLHQKGLGL